jgi:hypothetical protein
MPEYVYVKDRQAEILNHVVEKVLNRALGKGAAEILFEYLESNHSLKKFQIAENFDSFNRALEHYLGSGAAALERMIAQSFEMAWQDDTGNVDLTVHQKIAKLA